jgi:hypothetical protein
MKIYGEEDTRMSRKNGGSHHAKVSSRLVKTIPVFLIAFFSFLRWKIPSKEICFRMFKTLRKTWWPNWTPFLRMPLLTVFRNLLNDSTIVFKLAEINLDRNKTFLFPCIFYFFFCISPGTLLPDLVVVSTHNFGKSLIQQYSMWVLSENIAAAKNFMNLFVTVHEYFRAHLV